MAGATGANLIFGYRRNTNAWGSGGVGLGAAVVGAGHQMETEALPLTAAVELIQNQGLTGQGTRRPSKAGNRIVQADIGPLPLYFRGLEDLVAPAMGAAPAPSQLGGSAAYEQAMNLAGSVAGIYGTAVAAGADHPAVREFPFVKVGGFTFDFQQNALAKLTVPVIAFDEFLNVGSPDPDAIVAPVLPANGDLTIAAQPAFPGPLSVLVTDGDASITELIIDFDGEDDRGVHVTERYQLSVDGLTWESANRFSRVDSAPLSGLAGTPTGDTVQVGTAIGKNNAGTIGSISLPSTADYQLVSFEQMGKVWINAQDGAAFADGDLIFPDAVRVTLNRALQPKFTTRHGNRTDEPPSSDFRMVEIGINLPEWDSTNNRLLRDRLLAKPQKVHVQVQGPIAAATFPLEWSFFLNNVQFREGGVPISGPGEARFDLVGEATRALTAATGAPSWSDLQPLSVRNVNLRTTSPLA